MTIVRAVVACAAVLALAAGCSSDTPSSPQPPVGDAIQPTATPAALEGPVTVSGGTTHAWPDGITATLTKMEHVPADWSSDDTKGLAVIRVTVDAANTGTEPLPLEPSSRTVILLYGDARHEAKSAVGWAYDNRTEQEQKSLRSEEPQRIPAGGTVPMWDSMLVPEEQLGELAVQVELPALDGIRDPYTFTDAHTLLTTVR